jgi:hypothetical protein
MEEYDDIDETRDEEDSDEDDKVEMVLLSGESDSGTKLLKFFLGAAILDGNGSLQISRKALSEFVALCENNSSFELWADPDFNGEGIELSLKWHE